MSESKWISGLKDDMPVTAAARRVLQVRLEAVRDRLAPAVFLADQDVEHVHQLRVSTRRAGAALRIFRGCLPDKAYKSPNKKLRAVRRAAGEARDWDVFRQDLEQRLAKSSTRQRAGLEILFGIATGHRMAAQEVLREATQATPIDWDSLISETLGELRSPGNGAMISFRDLAVQGLRDLIDRFDQAAAGDLQNYEHLHQVRIEGKRLRYAIEVFAPCFKSALKDELYPMVEKMQSILGAANDSHVAAGRLENIRMHLQAAAPGRWKRYQPGIEKLLQYHQEHLPAQRELFLLWLAEWHTLDVQKLLAD